MASTGQKWGIGCGIGCAFIVLVFGGLGTCGYLGAKKLAGHAEKLDVTYARMDSTFGQPTNFTPPADGRIPAERIEAFLAARDAVEARRFETANVLEALDGKADNAPANVFAKIKAGVSFIPAMLGYIDARNQALLEQGMGLGEYQYIYALAYFDYLHKDTADGPKFDLNGSGGGKDSGHVRWGVQVDSESGNVRERRSASIRRMLNRNLSAMARNQLAALDGELAAGGDPGLARWREQLAAELALMETEPRRILWETSLPAPIADSLEPYRDRLDASYGGILNIVEMGLVDHD